ncbi:MAG: outer membrane beta-barrel protein [Bacteroidia bacterium]|nr:outer membrane beta-barrel protein [Bacteroidia bacterium]
MQERPFFFWAISLALTVGWAQEEREYLRMEASPSSASEVRQRKYRFVVLDAQTQEPLAGAYIFNLSDSSGKVTDTTGVADVLITFHTDTAWVEVRYLGYETQRLPLTPKGSPQQKLLLTPEGIEQTEVVIVTLRVYRTEVSLLATLKETPQIATGLSGQVIEKTPDKTLAQVLGRVAGVSVYDGKFLNIRGMGQRYNAVLINRLPAPQTEPDSRGFDLTLFPSGLVDQVLVYKSASAEQTGDFGGGVVDVITRRSEEERQMSLSWQGGYLRGTTFEKGFSRGLPLRDMIGIGIRERSLPTNFPSDLNSVSASQAAEWSRKLPVDFSLRTSAQIPLNTQVAFQVSTPVARRIWTTWVASHSQGFQTMRVQRYRYELISPEPGRNPRLFAFEDFQTTWRVRWLGFQNWIWMPSPKNQVELNAFLSRMVDEEFILREGYSLYQRADARFRNYSSQYLARTLGTLQLGGTHIFASRNSLRWDVGANLSYRDEPDFRRIRTVQEPNDSLYRIILSPGATIFDASRFYSQMRQYNVAQNLLLHVEIFGFQVRGGVQSEYRWRTFWARWFSYTYPVTGNPAFLAQWSGLSLEEAFSSENLSFLRFREGTNPTDRYQAEQLYIAPLLSADKKWGRWSLHTGLRYEYSFQRLITATATQDINLRIPFPLWLPFVNSIYHLSPSHHIRLAYNRSLNRPELREIAPFLYYNFALTVEEAGNPNLRPARLHNIDLRYEWLPTLDQIVAVGFFYKNIRNPIETYILRGADQPIIQFGNANEANLWGAEVEARLRWGKAFSTLFNASYVWSQVDMGQRVQGTTGTAASQARYRPLQSQAPYILNFIGIYAPPNTSWEVSSSLQVNGPRLWWVGDNFNPSVYEMPRWIWDFRLRRVFRRFFVEVQARDVLNPPFLYLQDTNLDGKISRREDVIFRFVRGSEWILQMGLLW